MGKIIAFEDYYDIENPAKSENGDIFLPIGVSDNGELEEMSVFAREKSHLLVTGHAGLGKSDYLHTVLSSLLLRYSHAQVNLWLFDLTGYEFRTYDKMRPPQVTGVWFGEEDAVAFIESLENEIARRNRIFMDREVTSFRAYQEDNPETAMPFLVVLIDAFDYCLYRLYGRDDSMRERIEHLFRMARAYGILFVVTAQDVACLNFRLPRELTTFVSLHQSRDSIFLQYGDTMVLPLASGMVVGEALVNVPDVHRVKLPYLSMETERRIIDKVLGKKHPESY